MKIGLVDIDGHHFPNLALMKLSAWHKEQGDSVEFADPMFGRYDRVYQSKVFTFTPECSDFYPCEVVRAGTGFRDYTTMLPAGISYGRLHITHASYSGGRDWRIFYKRSGVTKGAIISFGGDGLVEPACAMIEWLLSNGYKLEV